MKPIYKSLLIEAEILSVSLSLQAQVTSDEDVTTQDVQAESLEGLKVVLISPNVSGAKDLIASGECVLDGANININLQNLAQGIHRVQVSAVFGTQTCVIYALDLTVPAGALSDTPQEFEDEVTVVSTFGDGDKSGADASVYAKDGDGNAHITKPLTISGSVSEGGNTTASGDDSHSEGNKTTASGEDSHAEGYNTTASSYTSHAEGNNTTASGEDSHAEGYGTIANGEGSHAEGGSTTASGEASHAEGGNTTASGDNSHSEGNKTTASGEASHAEGGNTTASSYTSHAEGYNTTASGEDSHAEGYGTIASQDNQHVSGKFNVEDTDGDYAFIIGNGTADNARSNAFAIDWNGNLVLFNAGTPVVLTPAKLAQLIA